MAMQRFRAGMFVFGALLACGAARAQSGVNSVRIYTEPAGLEFVVDGQPFQSSVDLLWPAASKHDIATYSQVRVGSQYAFVFAYTNLSTLPLPGMPVTADPSLKWIKLQFAVSYALTLNLPDCPAELYACPVGARIQINTILYDRAAVIYIPAGQAVRAVAFPTSGYVFTGWTAVFGLGISTAFDITFPMQGPLTLTAFAQPANSVQAGVNIVTEPPQLQLLLDHTPFVAPISLEWGWGSVHSVGAPPLQYAQSKAYVFDSWSDGGAINHDVKVPSQMTAMTLVARYLPGTGVGFATSPAGLALTVDGYTSTTYDFVWASGTVHKISAPATQSDAQGRRYRFVSWSDSQAADWTYTTGAAPPADRFRAVYQLLASVTFNTTPPGIALRVEGAICTAPCTAERDAGASIAVSAPVLLKTGEFSRLVFQGWNDAPAASRVIVLTGGAVSYTAAYTPQFQLAVAATPPEGAAFTLNPLSPDGFYNSGVLVSISANLAAGYRIAAWSGDVSGSSPAAALTLDSPKVALLSLVSVPAIAPLGVRSAALGAGADRVAAGSLLSIFGVNLAPDLAVGPVSPLAQTLHGVTVRIEEVLLPLIFVSPGQINAQLPASVTEGAHNLTVRWEGKPETTAPLVVTRNAPGLFGAAAPEQPLGSFLHENGQPVTAEQPARAGESLTLLGTGFGPYQPAPPDGFLLGPSAGYMLADAVTILCGDADEGPVVSSGLSGIAVGVDAVRFQVPFTLPDGPLLPVRIRVNGVESNAVLLPVAH